MTRTTHASKSPCAASPRGEGRTADRSRPAPAPGQACLPMRSAPVPSAPSPPPVSFLGAHRLVGPRPCADPWDSTPRGSGSARCHDAGCARAPCRPYHTAASWLPTSARESRRLAATPRLLPIAAGQGASRRFFAKTSSSDDPIDLSVALDGANHAQTPDELMDETYEQLRQNLAQDLLALVREAAPAFFERLAVELLVKMGYGGTRRDAGQAVG